MGHHPRTETAIRASRGSAAERNLISRAARAYFGTTPSAPQGAGVALQTRLDVLLPRVYDHPYA